MYIYASIYILPCTHTHTNIYRYTYVYSYTYTYIPHPHSGHSSTAGVLYICHDVAMYPQVWHEWFLWVPWWVRVCYMCVCVCACECVCGTRKLCICVVGCQQLVSYFCRSILQKRPTKIGLLFNKTLAILGSILIVAPIHDISLRKAKRIMCEVCLIQCGITHSNMWHDLFVCVTRNPRIRQELAERKCITCGKYVTRMACLIIRVAWCVHMCVTTDLYAWHDAYDGSSWKVSQICCRG